MQLTMQSHTMPRALAVSAVIVAAGLVLLLRAPGDDAGILVVESTPPSSPAAPAPAPAESEQPSTTPGETPAAARIRELETMSETFRNTTFLIAIRDAGFVCHELLRVSGGFDDSPKWVATCSETLSYTVGVAGNGTLHVEPFMQYFDGMTPRVIGRDFEAPPQPAQPLPQPR